MTEQSSFSQPQIDSDWVSELAFCLPFIELMAINCRPLPAFDCSRNESERDGLPPSTQPCMQSPCDKTIGQPEDKDAARIWSVCQCSYFQSVPHDWKHFILLMFICLFVLFFILLTCFSSSVTGAIVSAFFNLWWIFFMLLPLHD